MTMISIYTWVHKNYKIIGKYILSIKNILENQEMLPVFLFNLKDMHTFLGYSVFLIAYQKESYNFIKKRFTHAHSFTRFYFSFFKTLKKQVCYVGYL